VEFVEAFTKEHGVLCACELITYDVEFPGGRCLTVPLPRILETEGTDAFRVPALVKSFVRERSRKATDL